MEYISDRTSVDFLGLRCSSQLWPAYSSSVALAGHRYTPFLTIHVTGPHLWAAHSRRSRHDPVPRFAYNPTPHSHVG